MTNHPNFTFIKTDKKLTRLNFDDILFTKRLGNYVEIFVKNNRKFVYYKSMKDLIERLPNGFMRIHNSYIVNLTNIEYYEDNQITIEDVRITVAKSYRDCFIEALGKIML